MVKHSVCLLTLAMQLGVAKGSSAEGDSSAAQATTHALIRDSECRDRVNKMMGLKTGDQVEILRQVKPDHPGSKKLDPNSALSRKLNITYVRLRTGEHKGEYCWVPTVDIR